MTILERVAKIIRDLETVRVLGKEDDINYRQLSKYMEITITFHEPRPRHIGSTIENAFKEAFKNADCSLSTDDSKRCSEFICTVIYGKEN